MKIFDITKYNNLEKIIAQITNEDIEHILKYSLHDWAKRINANASSVSRAIKRMGFSCYADFHDFLLVESNKYSKYVFNNYDDLASIKSYLSKASMLALNETTSKSNIGNINKASELICKSKRLIVFGIGFCGMIGEYLVNNLVVHNIDAFFAKNIYDVIKLIELNDQEMTFMIFSKSLRTKEIVYVIELIIKSKNKLIIVTTNYMSSMTLQADITIRAKIYDDEDSIYDLSSKFSFLIIHDFLVQWVINHKNVNKQNKVYLFESEMINWKKYTIDAKKQD